VYEENVRTAMLVLPPPREGGVASDDTIAGTGDVAPTILGLAGIPRAEAGLSFPGRDLLAPTLEPRIAYFHKNARPETWGLRDGRWKALVPRTAAEGGPELYDLLEDPTEQHDLAARHPRVVEEYARLCAQWYVHADAAYASRLEDWDPPPRARRRAPTGAATGPTTLALGRIAADGAFDERGEIAASDDLVAWTHGPAFDRDVPLLLEWTSPSGATDRVPFTHRRGRPTEIVPVPLPVPRAAGRWTLRVVRDGRAVLEASVAVAADGSTPPPAKRP
jgi:hypothetical protein